MTTIVNFGTFEVYNGEDGLICFKNEDGLDWYDMRNALTTWGDRGQFIDAVYGAWAMVEPETLLIQNVEHDPSRLMPGHRMVLGIDDDPVNVKIGQKYQLVSNTIIDKPPLTPQEKREEMPTLTKRQLRLALVRSGISLATVQGAISAMPEGLAKQEAQIEWDDASYFKRLHPLLVTIGSALGLTPTAIDTMWEDAINY
jgi:hypothetical protein